jgi:hypothetical protein
MLLKESFLSSGMPLLLAGLPPTMLGGAGLPPAILFKSSFASRHIALNSAAVKTPAPDLSYLLKITPASKSELPSAAVGLASDLALASLLAGEDLGVDFVDPFFSFGDGFLAAFFFGAI